jgi:ubiquinone/menaquinone biosynthesis C-methylase UbiE
LKQIRFNEGSGLFLDLGCGTGQWVDALANMNKRVVGVDVRQPRLEIASIFLNKNRAVLIRASAEYLPLRDNVFSNLFCYGVIMFIDPDRTLSESHRVLAKDGKSYVCWNALGWSLRLLTRFSKNMKLKRQALRTIRNTWFKKKGVRYYSRGAIRDLAKRNGFETIRIAGEGMISYTHERRSIYKTKYFGLDNVLEGLFTAA